MLRTVDRLTDINRKLTLGLSIVCLVLAMLLVSADAISRKFGYVLPGGVPITELLIAGLVFGGIVYAQTTGVHLYVGLLDRVLPRQGLIVTDLLGLFLGFASTALIAWFGFLQAANSWMVHEVSRSSIEVPYWPSRAVLAVGSTLLCLQFVLDAIRLLLTGEDNRSKGRVDTAT